LAQRLSQALGSSFTLEGEIGRGGMGVVYHARDERLKRKVAVKVLPPELAFREEIRIRFLREAETAARLSHPHIVPIHSVGEGPDGLVYFVMAYVGGESLAARLKRRERLPPEEARRIMMETADALGAGHDRGIIHRDVKPDNILLEGSRGRTVLTDFGIAKALTSTTGPGTLTATGVAIGTPHYMSPEQAAGDREIDGRSDIYSLGVVGYQMLAGELPFSAPTVPGILLKQITEQAPNLKDRSPTCPDDLASCVMRSLEKEPSPLAHRRRIATRVGIAQRSTVPAVTSRERGWRRGASDVRWNAFGGGAPPLIPGGGRRAAPRHRPTARSRTSRDSSPRAARRAWSRLSRCVRVVGFGVRRLDADRCDPRRRHRLVVGGGGAVGGVWLVAAVHEAMAGRLLVARRAEPSRRTGCPRGIARRAAQSRTGAGR
jgi:serine/threonine-protein kinase